MIAGVPVVVAQEIEIHRSAAIPVTMVTMSVFVPQRHQSEAVVLKPTMTIVTEILTIVIVVALAVALAVAMAVTIHTISALPTILRLIHDAEFATHLAVVVVGYILVVVVGQLVVVDVLGL